MSLFASRGVHTRAASFAATSLSTKTGDISSRPLARTDVFSFSNGFSFGSNSCILRFHHLVSTF